MSPGGLFASPEALPVLLLAPLAWLLFRTFDRAAARRLERAVGPRVRALAPGAREDRRRLRSTLSALGLLLALLATLQPLWGEGPRLADRPGVSLVLCLDVSRSMLARDLPPDRLERARREIRALAGRLRGDRLALVAFAGEARLVVPLTRDMDSFARLVEEAGPLSVRRGGTDLGAALEAAIGALEGDAGGHEAVVLLTDGEDLEGRGLAVAARCRERRITVHCAGFGSARGSKIPVAGEAGEMFLRDRSGAEVVSAMDRAALGRIAGATGGELVEAGTMPLPLVELYEKRILPMARRSFEGEERRERKNRFQWPLLVAILAWMLELSLAGRRAG